MIHVLRGPVAAGKTQHLREIAAGDIVLDVTAIWAALLNLERDRDGKYRERLSGEDALTLALYLRAAGVREAARRNLTAWVTLSSSQPEAVERVREKVLSESGVFGRVVTRDPGPEAILDRLRREDGSVSEECEKAIRRWYGRR